MRYLRYTLILLLAFMVSLGVEAKKVKLSKNIIYEGAVQKGEPNGKGCLKVYSCLDKNFTLLSLEGEFYNAEVRNASLKINGGTKITAPSIYFYKITTTPKNIDAIDFQISANTKWSIEDTKSNKVEDSSCVYIRCRCDMKSDKKWYFVAYDESERLSILSAGYISSNFINYDTPLSVIGEDASNIKKQDVCYRLFATLSGNTDAALDFVVLYAQKTYLSNGIEIEHRDNSFYCKYPNANFVVLNKDGSINNYKIALEGGNIERSPDGTTIVYKDGNTFTSSDNNPIKLSKNIASCINVSEVTILNGDLSHPNGIVDIYCDGDIVGHKFPLKDRGWFICKNNKKNGLIYPDGSKFVASTENGLLPQKDYSTDNDTKDYTLVTGVFTNGLGHKTEYINGEIQTKDFDDIKQMAVGRSIVELSIPDGQGQGIGYCSENGCLYFPFLEAKEPKQIDKKHYYIKVKDGLCLSFPKSFVLKSGNNVADIQTVDFRSKKGGMFGMEWLGSKYTLVWVYEPVTEINNVQYGITKGVWVVNKINNKIEHDLCKCLKSGNNNRYNWVYDNTPYVDKRKYHARGRIETCSWCGGSGDMSDWRAGHYIRCTTCGGKGWVVEHYW